MSRLAVAAVAIHGAGDIVVGGAGCADDVEREAGKRWVWRERSYEEGGAQVDFRGGG